MRVCVFVKVCVCSRACVQRYYIRSMSILCTIATYVTNDIIINCLVHCQFKSNFTYVICSVVGEAN